MVHRPQTVVLAMKAAKPSSRPEALQLLAQYRQDAMVVAGGTDAVLHLVQKKQSPAAIITLEQIPNIHKITVEPQTIRLAAGVTYNQMLADETLKGYQSAAATCNREKVRPSQKFGNRRRFENRSASLFFRYLSDFL